MPIPSLRREFHDTILPLYTPSKPPSYRSNASSPIQIISQDWPHDQPRESENLVQTRTENIVQTRTENNSNRLLKCLSGCGNLSIIFLKCVVLIILSPILLLLFFIIAIFGDIETFGIFVGSGMVVIGLTILIWYYIT